MLKGFTLIELLVVIAVLGVITTGSIALLNPSAQLKKANDTKRKADLAQLQAAFELYRADIGSYPDSLPGCGSSLTYSGTTYLKSTPCDPITKTSYAYRPSASPATSYSIVACLGNTVDAQADSPSDSICASGSVSYTVRNP